MEKDIGDTDEIFVNGVRAYGFHGVFEEENREGQRFSVDLKMRLSLAEAAATDDLEKTVDYSRAAALAKECVEARPPFRLIERLAGTIAEKILAEFPRVAEVEVRVHKPDAPVGADFDDLGVTLRRRRERLR